MRSAWAGSGHVDQLHTQDIVHTKNEVGQPLLTCACVKLLTVRKRKHVQGPRGILLTTISLLSYGLVFSYTSSYDATRKRGNMERISLEGSRERTSVLQTRWQNRGKVVQSATRMKGRGRSTTDPFPLCHLTCNQASPGCAVVGHATEPSCLKTDSVSPLWRRLSPNETSSFGVPKSETTRPLLLRHPSAEGMQNQHTFGAAHGERRLQEKSLPNAEKGGNAGPENQGPSTGVQQLTLLTAMCTARTRAHSASPHSAASGVQVPVLLRPGKRNIPKAPPAPGISVRSLAANWNPASDPDSRSQSQSFTQAWTDDYGSPRDESESASPQPSVLLSAPWQQLTQAPGFPLNHAAPASFIRTPTWPNTHTISVSEEMILDIDKSQAQSRSSAPAGGFTGRSGTGAHVSSNDETQSFNIQHAVAQSVPERSLTPTYHALPQHASTYDMLVAPKRASLSDVSESSESTPATGRRKGYDALHRRRATPSNRTKLLPSALRTSIAGNVRTTYDLSLSPNRIPSNSGASVNYTTSGFSLPLAGPTSRGEGWGARETPAGPGFGERSSAAERSFVVPPPPTGESSSAKHTRMDKDTNNTSDASPDYGTPHFFLPANIRAILWDTEGSPRASAAPEFGQSSSASNRRFAIPRNPTSQMSSAMRASRGVDVSYAWAASEDTTSKAPLVAYLPAHTGVSGRSRLLTSPPEFWSKFGASNWAFAPVPEATHMTGNATEEGIERGLGPVSEMRLSTSRHGGSMLTRWQTLRHIRGASPNSGTSDVTIFDPPRPKARSSFGSTSLVHGSGMRFDVPGPSQCSSATPDSTNQSSRVSTHEPMYEAVYSKDVSQSLKLAHSISPFTFLEPVRQEFAAPFDSSLPEWTSSPLVRFKVWDTPGLKEALPSCRSRTGSPTAGASFPARLDARILSRRALRVGDDRNASSEDATQSSSRFASYELFPLACPPASTVLRSTRASTWDSSGTANSSSPAKTSLRPPVVHRSSRAFERTQSPTQWTYGPVEDHRNARPGLISPGYGTVGWPNKIGDNAAVRSLPRPQAELVSSGATLHTGTSAALPLAQSNLGGLSDLGEPGQMKPHVRPTPKAGGGVQGSGDQRHSLRPVRSPSAPALCAETSVTRVTSSGVRLSCKHGVDSCRKALAPGTCLEESREGMLETDRHPTQRHSDRKCADSSATGVTCGSAGASHAANKELRSAGSVNKSDAIRIQVLPRVVTLREAQKSPLPQSAPSTYSSRSRLQNAAVCNSTDRQRLPSERPQKFPPETKNTHLQNRKTPNSGESRAVPLTAPSHRKKDHANMELVGGTETGDAGAHFVDMKGGGMECPASCQGGSLHRPDARCTRAEREASPSSPSSEKPGGKPHGATVHLSQLSGRRDCSQRETTRETNLSTIVDKSTSRDTESTADKSLDNPNHAADLRKKPGTSPKQQSSLDGVRKRLSKAACRLVHESAPPPSPSLERLFSRASGAAKLQPTSRPTIFDQSVEHGPYSVTERVVAVFDTHSDSASGRTLPLQGVTPPRQSKLERAAGLPVRKQISRQTKRDNAKKRGEMGRTVKARICLAVILFVMGLIFVMSTTPL